MKKHYATYLAQAAGWILFFSLVLGFVVRSPNSPDILGSILSGAFIIFCLVYIFLFYFNSYFLIPRLYLRKKYAFYFSIVLVLLLAVILLKPFDRLMQRFPSHQVSMMKDGLPGIGRGGPPPGPPPGQRIMRQRESRTDIVSIILFIAVWSLSTAMCIIRQWRMTEQRAVQAEADKANAELTFLKAQINPHFLFNTLNNIYSLAITRSDNTAASIMKLSNILRYVTDEIRENFVPLQNEVDCMGDYIDLQRLRLGKKMRIDFSVKGDLGLQRIAPLILMTFIENVFKYGISNHEPSDIIISLDVTDERIRFFCQNKLYDSARNTERTGIGISNTRQRLQHLYSNRHSLNINTENGLFTVELTLLS